MLSKLKTLFLLIATIVLSSTPCFAETFSGKVVSVTDGDTIQVMHDGRPEKIRLNGIDAPEKSQAFGERAKQFTASRCFGQQVSVITYGQDRYRRTIADIQLPEGTLLSNELVGAGFAWWYRKYAPNNTTLQQLEAIARRNHTGLWADTNPVEPSEYRHFPNSATRPLEGHLSTLSSATYPAEQAQAPAVLVQQTSALKSPLQGVVNQSLSEPLKGGVQESETTRLHGRVGGEQRIPQVYLRVGVPNNSAIMHIVQFKMNNGEPNGTPISAPLPLLQATVDHEPIRDGTNLLRAPLRATTDSEHPPLRATINDQPRSEVSEQPPQRRPDFSSDRPPVRIATRLDDQPSRRYMDDGSPLRADINVNRIPVRSITQAAVVLMPPLPDRVTETPTPRRSFDVPKQSQKVRVQRKRKEHTEADIISKPLPQTASIDESLLWDLWYKHVNDLVCVALAKTMPAHGNPAGSNRVHITVWPNHHIDPSLIQGSSQRFNAAVLEAYSSLNGNSDLEFPRGTQRQLINYETAHMQEISATPVFDSRTIHGDMELVK